MPTQGQLQFKLSDLESMQGLAPVENTMKTGHAMLLNEYGWLWLNRDGSPTLLTDKLYPLLLGKQSSAADRFAMEAYLLAAETEFWRAYRRYAGVLHFAYLTASDPNGFTSDNFTDVNLLTLEPHFADYMGEAFKPLGVFINFFPATLQTTEVTTVTVLVTNDLEKPRSGRLLLAFVDEAGTNATEVQTAFHLKGLGADSYNLTLPAPGKTGKYTLRATATPDDAASPTVSRRLLSVVSREVLPHGERP